MIYLIYRYVYYSFKWVVVGNVDVLMLGWVYIYLDFFVFGEEWMR